MKFYCFLISFAFSNVSGDVEERYNSVINHTNYHMLQVRDDLVSIIRKIICGKYTMMEKNYMLAVPDLAITDNTRYKYQEMLQNEITKQTGVTVPIIYREAYKSLYDLGEERRSITRTFINKMIHDILGKRERNITFPQLCQFIGVLMSVKYPYDFTTSATVKDGICEILDIKNKVMLYKPVNGEICQVKSDDVEEVIENLVYQID